MNKKPATNQPVATDNASTLLSIAMSLEDFLNSSEFHSTLLYMPLGQAVIVGDSLWLKSKNASFIIKTHCAVNSFGEPSAAAEKEALLN